MERRVLLSTYRPIVGPLQYPDGLPTAAVTVVHEAALTPTLPETVLSGSAKPFVGPLQYPNGNPNTVPLLGPHIGGSGIEIWIYQGPEPGDWSTAANWYLGRVPQSGDHVFFGHWFDVSTGQWIGSDSPCQENSGGVAGILEMNANYGGTLTLNGALSVGPGGVIMAGGTIAQPNGDSSKITSTGPLDWTNGILNNAGKSTLELAGSTDSTSTIDQSAADTADTIVVDTNNVLSFASTLTQTVNFTDGAGITLSGGTVNVYHNSAAGISTISGSSGQVTNNGGTFQDEAAHTSDWNNQVTIGLAYVGTGGTLQLNGAGVMEFTGSTSYNGNSGSVFQAGGKTMFNAGGATLTADAGYLQSAGETDVMLASTAFIKGNLVVVSGGSVKIPVNGQMYCYAPVTVSGGTYYANVDAGTLGYSIWIARGASFTITGAASLNVNTVNVPVGWSGPANPIPICESTNSGLTDTGPKNDWPGGHVYAGYSYHNPGWLIDNGMFGDLS